MVETASGNFIYTIMDTQNHNSVLVVGCIHGDEPQGEYLIARYIEKNPKTRLMFIPSLNPDGVSAKTRVNSRGVDLNRNFPTKNWELSEKGDYYGGDEPASELETKFLIDIVEEYKPKLILTLHAPYKVVNYDGNAEYIAQKISDIIGYPVEKSIGYPTPGSFGTWAGVEKGIPVITLELDEEVDIKELEEPVFNIFRMLEHFVPSPCEEELGGVSISHEE